MSRAYQFDEEEVFTALGSALVAFNWMEFQVTTLTEVLVASDIPWLAAQMAKTWSAGRKVELLRDIASMRDPEGASDPRFKALLSEIEKIVGERNVVVHGIMGASERGMMFKLRQRHPAFGDEDFDLLLQRLEELEERAGQATIVLAKFAWERNWAKRDES